jgi:hypothetical protein
MGRRARGLMYRQGLRGDCRILALLQRGGGLLKRGIPGSKVLVGLVFIFGLYAGCRLDSRATAYRKRTGSGFLGGGGT